jgi:hypothetical protein
MSFNHRVAAERSSARVRTWFRTPLHLATALLVLLAAAPTIARGDVLTIPSPEGGSNGWRVTWDPNQNGDTLNFSFSAVTRILTKTVTFNNSLPLVVRFDEVGAATANSPETGGINVVLQENITNNSGDTWKNFTLFLEDLTPVDPNSVPNGGLNNAHPVIPHFHPLTGPSFAPFGKFTPFDAQPGIFLSNGPFPTSPAQFTWSNFKLHDREAAGVQRSFNWIEAPLGIPEPRSAILVGIGALCVWGYAWRRRKGPARVR